MSPPSDEVGPGPADNPHLAVAPVLAGAPLSVARRAAVLVHGRDQDESVMLDVAARLALPDVAYVLPVAAGATWYAGRYFDPIDDLARELGQALEAIESALALAGAAGIDDDRIVLGGFSQGACLVAELVARTGRRVAGVGVLTGSLLGRDGERVSPAGVEGLPMYFGFSRHDEWIAEAHAQATADAFAAAGAQVTCDVLDDREHRVSDRAVDGLRALCLSTMQRGFGNL